MNRLLKEAAFGALAAGGVLAMRRTLGRSRFRVVTYHGVDSRQDPVLNFDRLQTDPAAFTRHIEVLARTFKVVHLGDAVRRFLRDGRWPDRGLAITFDDGYRNNLQIAAPILKRLGVPATFFVTAGFVDRAITPWWYALREWLFRHSADTESDRASTAASLEARLRPLSERQRMDELSRMGIQWPEDEFYPFMSREECRELLAQGFDVQCHGVTHLSFSGETLARVREEIRASAAFIRDLGHEPWGLAYPYGHEPKNMVEAAAEMEACGLMAAFTTHEGTNRQDANPWQLKRWDLHGGYSALGVLTRVS